QLPQGKREGKRRNSRRPCTLRRAPSQKAQLKKLEKGSAPTTDQCVTVNPNWITGYWPPATTPSPSPFASRRARSRSVARSVGRESPRASAARDRRPP